MSGPPFRAALIDLNGTLHLGAKEIPGSVAALQRLRGAGIPLRFVSNTTKDTTAGLLQAVRGIGFDVADGEVFTSIAAARDLVRDRRLTPLLLLQPQAIPEFGPEAEAGYGGGPYDSVVVGLANEAFSFENMNAAFRVLLDHPQAPLIAIHKGKYFREPDGSLSLGPGPFVAALEFATGHTCEIVGKPEAAFFQAALASLGCSSPETAGGESSVGGDFDRSAVVMVGDDVRGDVGGAQAAGLCGVLVQTGKYRPGDELAHGIVPDAVVHDFAAAVEYILSHNSRVQEQQQ